MSGGNSERAGRKRRRRVAGTLWLSLDKSFLRSLRLSTCNHERDYQSARLHVNECRKEPADGAHQIVLAVLGAQHGRHLRQVGVVAALLGAGGETKRDDSLGDVDQVHLIALLHGLDHTLAPVRGAKGSGEVFIPLDFVSLEYSRMPRLS